MSQDLSQVQAQDPTQGKYVPQYTGEARIVSEDEDIPNGAYEPKARFASEATIVKDVEPLNEEELSDTAKRLLELDLEGSTSEPAEANTQVQPQAETKEVQPQADDEYKPDEVDYTYLQLGQDFGVPDLDVDETDPEFSQWKEGFEKFLGHSWDEYKQARTEMRQARQIRQQLEQQKYDANLQKQAQFIKQKWGVDDNEYHRRMQEVVKVFSQLDPATQRILDRDPSGALKIWKDIEMSQEVKKPNVPQYEKSRPTSMTSSSNGKPLFTGSQINAMPEAQKQQLWNKIMSASQQGLVDWSR